MRIDHENKQNVVKFVNASTAVTAKYFMKKWWLEHNFKDKFGNDLQFRGWINTVALDLDDFPETLSGSFWASKVEENGRLKDGTVGMLGHFDIGFGEDDNYVFGSVYPVYLSKSINYSNNPSREKAELILEACKPLEMYDRFEARIEDCLVLSSTYVDTIEV
jgi:hypothetical protein